MDYIDNKVIIRSVYGKVGQKYTIQACKNPKTDQFPDHVKHVDSKGDMILTDAERNDGRIYIPETFTITFESGKEFNLEDPLERAQWEAIKFCPIIAQAIDQRDSKGNLVLGTKGRYSAAELYIERPGYETSKKVSRKQRIHDAEAYIFNDPEGADGRLKMARLLGRNLRNSPDSDIKDYLLDIAAKDPEKIIKLYTGEDLPLRLLFMEAKDKNIIYSKNKVYLYGDGIPLGGTVDAVMSWMRDPRNAKMIELIKRDTYDDELKVTNPNALKAKAAREAEKRNDK